MLGQKPYLTQQPPDFFLPLLPGGEAVVDIETFADDVTHLLPGVQAGHGILEDHLHVRAEHAAGVTAHPAGDVPALEGDAAARGGVQADDAAADGGFARA